MPPHWPQAGPSSSAPKLLLFVATGATGGASVSNVVDGTAAAGLGAAAGPVVSGV